MQLLTVRIALRRRRNILPPKNRAASGPLECTNALWRAVARFILEQSICERLKISICLETCHSTTYAHLWYRSRHQLNHNPKGIFRCHVPNCCRSFVREDLHSRHETRHMSEYLQQESNGSKTPCVGHSVTPNLSLNLAR